MVVSHTKFTPDSCFELLKQKFHRTHVQCLTDMARVIEDSATVNSVKIAENKQGDILVHTYNWLSFFTTYFKKLSEIWQYHQFCFSSAYPGTVIYTEQNSITSFVIQVLSYAKNTPISSGISVTLLKSESPALTLANLLSIVPPTGLSAEHQWYLYDKIRPFCDDSFKDITCPHPLVPTPRERAPGTTTIPSPPSSPSINHTRASSLSAKLSQVW